MGYLHFIQQFESGFYKLRLHVWYARPWEIGASTQTKTESDDESGKYLCPFFFFKPEI